MEGKLRLLVVDDDEGITDSLRIGLEHNGFEVVCYNNPVEAVSTFRPGTYNLVILDIRMPEMSGFDAYRELKRKDGDVNVCFLTAYDVHEEEFRRMFPHDSGVHKFLRKPITISALKQHLNQLILAA